MNEMSCAYADRPEVAERYLTGDLNEAERDAFEAHFFECQRCLAELRALEAMQVELRTAASAAAAAPPRRVMWRPLAAAAAIVAVAGTAWTVLRPRPVLAPSFPVIAPTGATVRPAVDAQALLALARIEPPRYVALDVRGDADDRDFTAAMQAYAASRFAEAATGLRRVRTRGRNDAATNFFLGVSCLMSEDLRCAAEALRRALDNGPSPYRSTAGLYLGKALVRLGDLDGAERAWLLTQNLGGDRARDADDLRRRLAALRGAPPPSPPR